MDPRSTRLHEMLITEEEKTALSDLRRSYPDWHIECEGVRWTAQHTDPPPYSLAGRNGSRVSGPTVESLGARLWLQETFTGGSPV